jgi:hypothetical protein
MTLRRRKSKKTQAANLLGDYLKLKAAGKAAKGAKKAAEGTAVVKAAKRTPLKKASVFAGATAAVTAAAIVAVKVLRGGGDGGEPAAA